LDFGTNLVFKKKNVTGFQQLGSHMGENNQCCFQTNYHLIWYQSNLIMRTSLKSDLRIMGPNESYPTLEKTYLHYPSPPKEKMDFAWVYTKPFHWLHETFISKIVCHHLLPGLMVKVQTLGHILLIWYNHLSLVLHIHKKIIFFQNIHILHLTLIP